MKVLIVDDHSVVRAGLRRLLGAEPQSDIREARTGQEALAAFRDHRPGLVILDLNLPGSSGLELIARFKAEDVKVQILVLSMHDNPVYVRRALQAGAAGYVSKNAPADEILEAIRRVAGGHAYIEHEIAQELALWNVRAPSHPLTALSTRDLEILRLLGEGCSMAEIAGAVGLGYKTVANHCSQLKAKLGVARTADLIRVAVSLGISRGDVSPAAESDL
jgi:two-component system, NarL family, invasion response regulator UvrY